MTHPNKPKVSRAKTLARLLEVADRTVGDNTPLDDAFAAFERFGRDANAAEADGPQAIADAQTLVRQLLRPK
jgi:hypothetical protein